MSVCNNLVNVKINSVLDSGQVNMGDAINIHPNNADVSLGGTAPIGDYGKNIMANANDYFDPDIKSQS